MRYVSRANRILGASRKSCQYWSVKAGVSMYGSISRAGLKAGDWLVLPGAGGGLGHLWVCWKPYDIREEVRASTRDLVDSSVLMFWRDSASLRGVQIAREKGYKVVAIDTWVETQISVGWAMFPELIDLKRRREAWVVYESWRNSVSWFHIGRCRYSWPEMMRQFWVWLHS